MSPVTRATSLTAILAILTLPRLASAQQVHSPSAADALFREGRQAVKDGDMLKACALFQKSYSLDPAPGTLMNIADCEERQGQLLQALQHFNTTAESLATGDARMSIALSRAASLDAKLPHLLLRIQGPSEQTRVMVEGPGGTSAVPAQSWNKPIAVTPGFYEVTVFDGAVSRHVSVDLSEPETHEMVFDVPSIGLEEQQKNGKAEAERRRREEDEQRVAVEQTRRSQAEMVAANKQNQEYVDRVQRDVRQAGSWGTILGGGLGCGIPGLLFSTVGIVGIGKIVSDKHTVEQHCNGKLCDQTGFDAARDGKGWSVGSPLFLVLGGALTSLGVYFVVKGVNQRTAVSLMTTPQGPRVGVMQAF
ncbi:MAG TPA: hypothetical protein VNG33_13480 [Polyangiaceae bacterium]|nr:hypothetical protein [Polyangiaceae bacterium]